MTFCQVQTLLQQMQDRFQATSDQVLARNILSVPSYLHDCWIWMLWQILKIFKYILYFTVLAHLVYERLLVTVHYEFTPTLEAVALRIPVAIACCVKSFGISHCLWLHCIPVVLLLLILHFYWVVISLDNVELDEMGQRIDDLEKNIAELMTQAGVEEK